MLALAPLFVLVFRRTNIEDRYLHERLEGYIDYAERVRHKLIPRVW
jgi:protein-S-isoprenylcysteine O-methyltransferase Ste14